MSRFVFDHESGYVRDLAVDEGDAGAWLTSVDEVFHAVVPLLVTAEKEVVAQGELAERYRTLFESSGATDSKLAALLDGFAPSEALPDEGQCVLLAVGNHNSVARYVSGQFIVSFGGERLRAEMDHVARWWPLPHLSASASLREPSELGKESAK